MSVTMTVHSPTVRDIKTRGTVGNTVVHMDPVSDNTKPYTEMLKLKKDNIYKVMYL